MNFGCEPQTSIGQWDEAIKWGCLTEARWWPEAIRSLILLTYVFIGVLLIIGFDALVQQRIQADQEEHVDDQQGYHPDDNDDDHLDDGCIAILVFAFAPGTEFLLFFLQFDAQSRQNDTITVAVAQNEKQKWLIVSWSDHNSTIISTYHFDGGTLSIRSMRSVSWVLFNTEFRLGQMHLQRLSS